MTVEGKVYIGIDPGLNGGIAVIHGANIKVTKTPLTKSGELDILEIQGIINSYANTYEYIHIGIEDVHSIFGASAKSNFQFGFGCGQLDAILKCNKIPYTRIAPKTWQKEMWLGVPKQENTKKTSLASALRLFPNVSLKASERCKTPHDGIVDALLIAEYVRRKNL